ncbi:MAG: tetratricopeptide repeat protein [Beijerinckiaceae bacterium]|nr:tetratricopeptide repeat protein [Beijerinckiaceae bacterium]
MRHRIILTILLLGLMLPAALANDLMRCQNTTVAGWQDACNRASADPKLTAKERAIVLTMRGAAEILKEDAESIANADRLFTEALKLDDSNGLAHLLLGSVLVDKLQFDQAHHHLNLGRKLLGKQRGIDNAFGLYERKKGNLAAAIVYFDAELRQYPESTTALVERAWTHHLAKNKRLSLRDMDKLMREARDDSTELAKYIRVYRDMDAIKEALPHLDFVLASPKTRSAALYDIRAGIHLDLMNYVQARDDFTKSLMLNGNNAESFIDRARAHAGLKDYKSAFFDLSQAEILTPKNWRIFANRGRFEESQNGCKSAIAEYNRSLELNPRSPSVLFWAAWCEDTLGNPRKAVDHLSAAIGMGSKGAVFFNNRGYAYQAMREFDLALEDYSKAIQIDAKYERAYRNRATIYSVQFQESGDKNFIAKGLADLDAAQALAPKSLDVLNSRATFYRRVGQCEKAIPIFRNVLDRDKKNANAMGSLGLCLIERARYRDAAIMIEKALAINPKHASNLNNLAWAKYKMGLPHDAIGYVERSLLLNPTDINALDTRGNVRLALGDRIGAIDDFQQVLERGAKLRTSKAVAESRKRLEELGAMPEN